MKKLLTLLLSFVFVFSIGIFAGCGHTHDWTEWEVTKAASCAKGEEARTCKGCDEVETREIDAIAGAEHVFDQYDENDRVYYYIGQGEFLEYDMACHNCHQVTKNFGQSWGTFQPIQKLMTEDRTQQTVRPFPSYKVIFNFDDSSIRVAGQVLEDASNTFKSMFEDKWLEIGIAGQPSRNVFINGTDDTLNTLPEGKADIKGKITLVNGTLTIRGPVDFSGEIIVGSGCTLIIEQGATINNTGSITVEEGATLTNNGTVTGNEIVNKN